MNGKVLQLVSYLCLDRTFQISLTHPPEVRKAFHFRQSIDSRGLFLPSKLSNPLDNSNAFPRPRLWTRHLNGYCLLCHPECVAGCWGPTAAHCHRCAHVRVWRADTSKSPRLTWNPLDGMSTEYLLNKDGIDRLGPEPAEAQQSQNVSVSLIIQGLDFHLVTVYN